MDYETKISVLLTGVSAYLPEPINLFIRGPSSVGKSYTATRTLKFFSKNDVWVLGKLSPAALIHMHGEIVDRESLLPIGPKPKRREYASGKEFKEALARYYERRENGVYMVDLKNKILLFLETPHPETFRILYPILSHDADMIEYKIAEKTKTGQIQTKEVIIKNWPAAIFIRAKDEYAEELGTRCFTVSPQEKTEKYRLANSLTMLFSMYPWRREDINVKYAAGQFLIENLKIHLGEISDIIIPFPGLDEIYPAELPRDMRDFSHLLSLVKSVTALNYFNRVIMITDERKYLLASVSDVKTALLLFLMIFETTRTGLSQHVLDFYHKCLAAKEKWYIDEAVSAYNATFTPKKARKTITQYLRILEDIGYISIEEDETDRRRNIYRVIELGKNWIESKTIQISGFNFEKSFENWFKKIGNNSHKYIIYSDEEKKYKEISEEELKQYIIYNSEAFPDFSTLFSERLNKINPEIRIELENIQIKPNLNEIKPELNVSEKPVTELRGESFGLPAKPFVLLERMSPIKWLPCSICQKTGQEFHVKFVDETEAYVCSQCAQKLREKWG